VKSVIGPGCVLDPVQFFKELKEIEEGGVDVTGKVFIANNTHVITEAHKEEDGKEASIGTTKRGTGPAYRDKYARTGVRAESVPELKPYLIDMYDEFHNKSGIKVLGEGAQGFGLDIDWGDYPYVTSSHCTTGGFLLNGIPFSAVKRVWGVAKMYTTYVGAKKFEPNDPIFEKIRTVGEEFGATTGRPRQVNWLDLDFLEHGIRINGVTHLVFNKIDVIREVGVWRLIADGKEHSFDSEEETKSFVIQRIESYGIPKEKIFFSEKKDSI
jgi:adenylosuccinate synthase